MPTLTIRKLIKFGDGGLVITIPKSWARYWGLNAGDQLQVVANDKLVISLLKQETIENAKSR